MTIEEKKLLVRDLIGRIPYGVMVRHKNSGVAGVLHDISVYPKYDDNDICDYLCNTMFFGDEGISVEYFKPILRPVSDMTKEEIEHICKICHFGNPADDYDKHDHRGIEIVSYIYKSMQEPHTDVTLDFDDVAEITDYLNSRHIDYRRLIEKGLAIKSKSSEYF